MDAELLEVVIRSGVVGHTDGWRCAEGDGDELVHDRNLRFAHVATADSVGHGDGGKRSTLVVHFVGLDS